MTKGLMEIMTDNGNTFLVSSFESKIFCDICANVIVGLLVVVSSFFLEGEKIALHLLFYL